MIPKFRAWDKTENKMWNVETIYIEDEWVKVNDGSIYGITKDLVRDYVLMQSTGLKDKNGNEIYEGDIVEFKYPYDKRIKTKGVIVWNDNKACFGISMEETTEKYELYRITAENYLTVIGNKFQNPYLLEDK
ncbi:YopX family protein [Staphylococcus epidermidis]|nr:YopX family protein [Staphylococcus epidermidis]MDH8981244.1 YopX family protein [Staphylococcus epidermidis]MDH8988680.1 YopX family protein [Staphylococcus epidermidis]MDH8992842.1 YopX family protein [Staphylococcus epidermidis]MDH8995072.1 YopX family protein [Staphylococcus epidermidis]